MKQKLYPYDLSIFHDWPKQCGCGCGAPLDDSRILVLSNETGAGVWWNAACAEEAADFDRETGRYWSER